ncbi:10512_t:CDS:2 [Dentiscutata heterogama]|uniref:10512_t:CDS:1 n=1 Tax=Dentiscutata heterogama TaxID=1316150 RepID=A0ACA9P239_9GLOM|nr:10512_t:CDS:2 [Dentiscutata heterogama]
MKKEDSKGEGSIEAQTKNKAEIKDRKNEKDDSNDEMTRKKEQ